MAGVEGERSVTQTEKKASMSRKEQRSPEAMAAAGQGSSGREQPAGAVSVHLQVEIPAEWSDEQVRQRIALVRQALVGGSDDSA